MSKAYDTGTLVRPSSATLDAISSDRMLVNRGGIARSTSLNTISATILNSLSPHSLSALPGLAENDTFFVFDAADNYTLKRTNVNTLSSFIIALAAGLPSSGSFTQSTLYTTAGSYTFTVPAGKNVVRVTVIGGGGGGGGGSGGCGLIPSPNRAGGPGGGGGATVRIIGVSPGQTFPVTVGAGGGGGAGGGVPGGTGSTGGASTATYTAGSITLVGSGGGGGQGGACGVTGACGSGGGASGGTELYSGGCITPGLIVPGSPGYGGAGGGGAQVPGGNPGGSGGTGYVRFEF